MTDETGEPKPKRVAMQVALEAERLAKQALGEIENIGALAEAAAESGGGAPVGGVLAELRDATQKIIDLIPGNLWAGKGGALATQEQVAEVRDQVGDLIDWRAGFLGADGPKGVWAVAETVDTLRKHLDLLDGRVDILDEWRAAELDPDNLGAPSELAEQLAEVREELAALKFHATSIGGGQSMPAAPHVLGLILQLQRGVAEIGKGREFKAENSRGVVTQQYSFRGVDDAQNAIGSVQRNIGLIGPRVTVLEKAVSTETVQKSGYAQVMTTVSVTVRYTFQSPVDGSEWSTEGCGMGRDAGDKAESKALAGAFKYALFHGLNIPVKGVFVDAETEDPRIEHEIGQGTADRREQTGYAQDRIDRDAGRTYGHGHAPIGVGEQRSASKAWDDPAEQYGEAMAAQAFDQAMRNPSPETIARSTELNAQAQQQRVDERPPAEQAQAALHAARQAAGAGQVAAIWNRAHELRILSMHVDGSQLGQHLIAVLNTLPGGTAVQLPGMEHYR
jgi:hypothetical protein